MPSRSRHSRSPSRVTGGNSATGIVTLTGVAPAGGATVTVAPRRRNMITVPATVTVPEGATSAAFVIATDVVHGKKDKSTEIDASYNGVTATATIAIAPRSTAATTAPAVAQCASLALAPCLTRSALDAINELSTSVEKSYHLYSPELNLFAETAASQTTNPPVAYEYIWFAGQPLVQVETSTGAIHWYLNDHLGTPILQTDADARVVWRPEYEPYGAVYAFRRGEAKHQPLRFPGQEGDPASDVAYNVYRWYRAGWGRYTQADPIGLNGGPNLFEYVGDEPVNHYDPYGLLTIPRDRHYQRCRTLRRGYAQRELDRVRRNPRCQSFFCTYLNSDLDRLLSGPLPVIRLIPEHARRGLGGLYSGGFFDSAVPDEISISMRECRAMEDFTHVLIHELGHFADVHDNRDRYPDSNHSDGCRAEIECFGYTSSLNCRDLGFGPYRAVRR